MTKNPKKPIYIIIGTRAQVIKMAPLMLLLEKNKVNYHLINTNQHTEKMDDLLTEFGLKMKFENIFTDSKEAKTMGLFGLWGIKMGLILLNPFSRKKILKEGRGIVLTHGDTATTAWAAIYGRLSLSKVMHIEAGLRSHNIFHPFPEELMRIITGWFSNYHMCPNSQAKKNIRFVLGKKYDTKANTMLDGVNLALKKISKTPSIQRNLIKKYKLPKRFGIVSIHRYENIFKPKPFHFLVNEVKKASKKIDLVFILHPSTKIQLDKEGLYDILKNNKKIHFIERLDFIDFLALTELSEFLMIDSGGTQEEMSYTGKPTVVLRKVTERPEGLGSNIVLSKMDTQIIADFLNDYKKYSAQKLRLSSPPSKIIYEELIKLI